jgi:hypothetical protein
MFKLQYQHTEGDSRLLYGMGGPLLVAVALIIALIISPSWVLLAGLMACVFVLTAVVLTGFSRMLDEEGDER